MLCALTHRRLKPGAYERFRAAWQPETWPPGWARAYHVRNVDDEDEIISFGFFDGTLEELRARQSAEDSPPCGSGRRRSWRRWASTGSSR